MLFTSQLKVEKLPVVSPKKENENLRKHIKDGVGCRLIVSKNFFLLT